MLRFSLLIDTQILVILREDLKSAVVAGHSLCYQSFWGLQFWKLVARSLPFLNFIRDSVTLIATAFSFLPLSKQSKSQVWKLRRCLLYLKWLFWLPQAQNHLIPFLRLSQKQTYLTKVKSNLRRRAPLFRQLNLKSRFTLGCLPLQWNLIWDLTRKSNPHCSTSTTMRVWWSFE